MTGLDVAIRQAAPIPLDARFTCAAGEVLALVGPSGCGKTTLLRAVAGVWRPREGRISVDAEVWFDASTGVFRPAHRRAVGMVFQSYALFPHMTALGNVMTAMDHLPARERATKAGEILEMLHLSGLEQRFPAALSGGQQQRVALARALARAPKALLLDEPFSAVDKVTRRSLYLEIADLRRKLGMPVVLVTHDLDEAMMLADRLTVLDQGRTLQSGAPHAVTAKPASAAVARVLGLRNIFPATVLGHDRAHGRTFLDWCGHRLEAALNTAFAVGESVDWVIPESRIPACAAGDGRSEENPLSGTIETVLALGASLHATLVPDFGRTDRKAAEEGRPRVTFTLPIDQAEGASLSPGLKAEIALPAEAIHLMGVTDGERSVVSC